MQMTLFYLTGKSELEKKSELGMKENLKEFELYCNKWRLNISVKNSKMLTINGSKLKTTTGLNFKIYNTALKQ